MATRRAGAAALAAFVSVAALASGAAAWWKRCALAEWITVRALERRGVEAALRVRRLDARGAEIAGLTLGLRSEDEGAAPDLELDRLTLGWSLDGLRAKRLDRIELRGLRIRARVGADGLDLGVLDALRAGDASSEPAPLALPFLEATLSEAEAMIESPQGPLRLRGSGSAAPEGDLVRATLTLRGQSSQGEIELGGGGTIGLASQEIAATGALAGVTPWGRAEGTVRALGSLSALRVEFSASALPDAERLGVAAEQPIAVHGVATRDEQGRVAASATVSAGAVAAAGVGSVGEIGCELALQAEGDVTSATGTFSARGIAALEDAALREIAGDFSVRDEQGARTGEARFGASGVSWSDLGNARRAEGLARLRGDELEVDVALERITLPDLARAEAATARVALDLASGVATLRLESPQALAPELARIEGLAADVRLDEAGVSGTLRAARLVELSQPALIAPLRIEAQLSGPLERISLTGKAHTPGDGLTFQFSGALEPAAARLELAITLPETDIAAKTRQPGRVFPWLDGLVTGAAGRIGGQALAYYHDGVLASSGSLAFNGTDVRTSQATVHGLTGVVSATGLDPLVTPPGQLLWMRSVETAFPLANGSLRFQLLAEEVLRVEHGEWSLAGGLLTLAGDLALDVEDRLIELHASGLALDQLLAALDFEGLAGTGVLEGTIPVRQRGEQFSIERGVLHAVGEGVVRFTSGAGGEALAERQPAIRPVLGALTDLQYTELTLTLNGELTDSPGIQNRLEVKVQVKGRNPNFRKGQPVILNVNLDLPITLLRSLLLTANVAGATAPEDVLKALKSFGAVENP